MGVELWDMSDPTRPQHRDDEYHAVTITGFRLPSGTQPTPDTATGTLFEATRISKLYVHDDQVGPFSRLVFDGIPITVNGQTKWSVHSSWKGKNGQIGSTRMIPYMLMVPVYHKIRIPLLSVKQTIGGLDSLIEEASRRQIVTVSPRLTWSIQLTTVNAFRKRIKDNPRLDNTEKVHLLSANSPRFLWQATAQQNGSDAFDLLFDATDIEQGRFFYNAVIFDTNVASEVKKLSIPFVIDHYEGSEIASVLKWLAKRRV